ncbi:Glutathione S-transferase [hydrothermal vent metagenome]|uniref:Glutathione S-transferase n=1 Tax=hydrothermal vent metagenome TaxID=652676 RepID=A0A3B0X4K7_9ZZZZ
MSTNNTLELVSFKICPFVQRSVIALNEKGVDFKIKYIDLDEQPEWFKKISPLGKVPVLKTDDTAIFESMVIAEYLEEAYEPKLHPQNALEKARHRSWIEYSSELTMKQFYMFISKTEEEFKEHEKELSQQFETLLDELSEMGPMFSGAELNLIDAAYAPVFMRNELFKKYYDLNLYEKDGRIDQWSKALLALDSVKNSVCHDFESAFMDYFCTQDSYLKNIIDSMSKAS